MEALMRVMKRLGMNEKDRVPGEIGRLPAKTPTSRWRHYARGWSRLAGVW